METSELISRELGYSHLAQEITRVLLTAKSPSRAMRTFLLGTAQLLGVQRLILFRPGGKDPSEWKADQGVGLTRQDLRSVGFREDQEPVAQCLNGDHHLLIDRPAARDPFLGLGAEAYLLLPVVAPPWLSQNSPQAKSPCEALLWIDVSRTSTPLTAQVISHVAGLAQKAGLVYDGFRSRQALSSANSELRHSNRELESALAALRRAQKKLNDDLDQARILQDGLLPKTVPTQFLRGGSFRYVPAGQVGGDYYDCFQIGRNSLGMVVADVSGHGIAAALIMTMFKVLLKTLAEAGRGPAEILRRINGTFCEELDGRHFVTVFLGIFDAEKRLLTYSNAGHIPQLLIRQPAAMCDLDMQELTSQGLVLGMFPDPMLGEGQIELPDPFRLVLFTDGISEAHGPQNAMFGMERVRQLVRDTADSPAEEVGTSVMNALAAFSGAATPNSIAGKGPEDWEDLADDATLVILDL